MLLETPRRLQQVARRGRLDAGLGKGQRLAVVARQLRFVIERVNLRRSAVHEQEDDLFGTGREVRRRWQLGSARFVRQQGSQRKAAESGGAGSQHVAARTRNGECGVRNAE